MIRALRNLADWLQKIKCAAHNKWNAFLNKLKTNCACEKLEK